MSFLIIITRPWHVCWLDSKYFISFFYVRVAKMKSNSFFPSCFLGVVIQCGSGKKIYNDTLWIKSIQTTWTKTFQPTTFNNIMNQGHTRLKNDKKDGISWIENSWNFKDIKFLKQRDTTVIPHGIYHTSFCQILMVDQSHYLQR